ncbi:hypothetical protein [Frankia sp. CcWB3]
MYDTESAALYLPTPGQTVRLDVTSGKARWATATTAPFNPATPVATPWGLAVADAGRGIALLDYEDGTTLWRTDIDPAIAVTVDGTILALDTQTLTTRTLTTQTPT